MSLASHGSESSSSAFLFPAALAAAAEHTEVVRRHEEYWKKDTAKDIKGADVNDSSDSDSEAIVLKKKSSPAKVVKTAASTSASPALNHGP
jgi:hypothetical protein